MLDKYFPEKNCTISNLDKEWMNPSLKQLLRRVQRELIKNGKSQKYKSLKSKFRTQKRKSVKSFYSNFVKELKTSKPSNWFGMVKKLGGLEGRVKGKVAVESLKGLTDQQAVEEVAKSMAAVSQSYKPIDLTQLPCYLPAEAPIQLNIFQILQKLKSINKTRSTLPIDIPDKLRNECALDIAEPLTDIINSCFSNGIFPVMWRREWVSALPKPNRDLETCSDLRKIASTSDYSKIFEKCLMQFITEDIGHKIDIQQFASKKGMGTEHLIVCMMDRVLSLLDKPGMTAVIRSAADWASAFDRTDPTTSIQKFIRMGVRSSLVPILVQFLTNRKMSVKFNNAESGIFTLIGGGPQGSQIGQETYIVASDDNADHVSENNRYKFCDDLNILELVMLGDALVEYDVLQHVPSDVGINQMFIDPEKCQTQTNLDGIAAWTDNNLMKLNEAKCDYQIFTRSRQEFAARFTVNSKLIDRKSVAKVLGVWLQEDGRWAKNTAEICKRAYAKMSMLSKLKYAGVSTKDLIQIYVLFIRSSSEYASVAFHSALTQKQAKAIERTQSTALKILLGKHYLGYEEALNTTGLETLAQRRENRCLSFSLKCIKHPQNKRLFPQHEVTSHDLRENEQFVVNHANNDFYMKSAIPYCQRLLNNHMREKEKEEARRI
jgi:hypothetical protein